MPDDYITIEGYVVSKRIDTVWLAKEPVSVWGRLTGYFTSNYGMDSIIVSKHNVAENHNIFDDLKINQEVRVYGDNLRESLPGKIAAYYIEIISND
ncbi:DUF3221 domain-containing protein [Sporosarcina thermotolerans]|nr:DUF3221 domain-containing protein [Sporosarcina thermotolerans]WHT47304.1 DUF3221 domain-containing protein [Sporosarcina thermotolerans]